MSTRSPLRHDVRQAVLRLILQGKLAPGSRINESQLSAEMGISRTPLREALFHLEQEGFVRANPARGFSVEVLSQQEVREIYPIIWTLESLAFRATHPLVKATIPDLIKINEQLAASDNNPARAIDIDTLWHEVLLKHCSNQRLLSTLVGLKLTAYRYEYIYMRDRELITTSVVQHQNIIEAITNKDINTAAEHLETNWQYTMEFLLRKLSET